MKLSFRDKNFELNDRLFWDLDKPKIDPEKHNSLIIQKTLTRGTFEEFSNLVKVYGKDTIVEECQNMPDLDALSLNYISKLFDVDKKLFKCYSEKQSNLLPYN